MDNNQSNSQRARSTRPASDQRVRTGTRGRDELQRREQELVEKATQLAIELYGPALKELEQH